MPWDRKSALPIYSVDTVEEAERLLVLTCKRSYPPESRYFLPFSGKEGDLERAGDYLERVHRWLASDRKRPVPKNPWRIPGT